MTRLPQPFVVSVFPMPFTTCRFPITLTVLHFLPFSSTSTPASANTGLRSSWRSRFSSMRIRAPEAARILTFDLPAALFFFDAMSYSFRLRQERFLEPADPSHIVDGGRQLRRRRKVLTFQKRPPQHCLRGAAPLSIGRS